MLLNKTIGYVNILYTCVLFYFFKEKQIVEAIQLLL